MSIYTLFSVDNAYEDRYMDDRRNIGDTLEFDLDLHGDIEQQILDSMLDNAVIDNPEKFEVDAEFENGPNIYVYMMMDGACCEGENCDCHCGARSRRNEHCLCTCGNTELAYILRPGTSNI